METEEKGELREAVGEVVSLILSISGWSTFQAETIVYWCIATYGFDDIRKFPILVIKGVFNSGKTTALEMLQSLAKQPFDTPRENRFITGSITSSMAGKLLSRGGTHVMDEADKFDESYLPHIFDKKSGEIDKQEQNGKGGWNQIRVTIKTPLAMHMRQPLKDPANNDRCITLATRKVDLTADGKREPDMRKFEPYQEKLNAINTRFCNWYDLPDSATSRALEKWRVLIHVAEKLGNDTYVQKAKAQMEMDKDTDISEEFHIAVFRHILNATSTEDTGEKIIAFDRRVETKRIKEEVEKDIVGGTSLHAVNMIAKELGFETGQLGGTTYIWLQQDETKRLQHMRDVAERIGYQDEALQ